MVAGCDGRCADHQRQQWRHTHCMCPPHSPDTYCRLSCNWLLWLLISSVVANLGHTLAVLGISVCTSFFQWVVVQTKYLAPPVTTENKSGAPRTEADTDTQRVLHWPNTWHHSGPWQMLTMVLWHVICLPPLPTLGNIGAPGTTVDGVI
jgi:hypothetical protein